MKRALLIVLALVVVVALLGAASIWGTLRASLPVLDGERSIAGLTSPVTVERDSAGVPSVTAATRADAAQALGYLHAQERFFQMDLLRRASAGELSALLGESTWRTDSTYRIHRFRQRARTVVERLPSDHRAVLDAYVDGVNAGREGLDARPFEYLALRQAPEPWRPEDTILAALAMSIDLQHDGGFGVELQRHAIDQTLPGALAEFLTPRGDAWDAPIEGDPFTPPPMPTVEEMDGFTVESDETRIDDPPAAGSNNWAVSGDLSETGSAMVADDMHLGLRLPHIWYRASLVVNGRRVTGVTLPGTPLMVVGSNGDVAWGFTNSYGDYIDYVRLEDVPNQPGVVRSDSGTVAVDTLYEDIQVGAEVRQLAIVETPWGPVTARDGDGVAYAMQWTAHRPEATNLTLMDVEQATTLDEALDAANRSGIPAQNFVAGDRDGRIGWTIAGQIPIRDGRDGRRPVDSSDPDARWPGFVSPADVPRVVDPADGRLWTANARVVSGDALAMVGEGRYAHGARARQIRDGLRDLVAPVTEQDLLAIQLDDRALFLSRWRDLLLSTLDTAGRQDELAEVVRDAWTGRAQPSDPAYLLVREWRWLVVDRAVSPFLASARQRVGNRAGFPNRTEAPAWALVTEQPAHLLPDGFDSWDALLLDAADALADRHDDPAAATWGTSNTLRMEHPMASVIPGVGDRLRMPAVEQFGDSRMPRVSGTGFGASQRMVVSPGHEERGIFHMPGGQAGHFLSPYWGAGHHDWVEGRSSPFLPGPTVWTLTLTPAE
ncbi:MAG: penicillin acylase family protein [Bacteroidota bacterium]